MKQRLGIILLFLFAGSAGAYAAPVAVPGSADAGRIIEDHKLTPEPSYSEPSLVVEEPKKSQAPAGAEAASFVLKKVILEGVTAYQHHELDAIYAPYIGKQITLAKVYDFASAVTNRYRNDGYTVSRAVVPPQKIKDGVIRIRVIEGYLDHVSEEGSYRKNFQTHQIIARISKARPLNTKTLEHELLLLNDIAGSSVKAVLKQPDNPSIAASGAIDLVLVFSDTTPETSVSLDNRGSRYIGPLQMGFQTGVNHILPGQQTTVSGLVSLPLNELQYLSLAHQLPLDSHGTSGTLHVDFAHSEPGFRLEPSDIASRSVNYGFSVTHPLIRSRAENFFVGGDFTVKESVTDSVHTQLYDDRLRIASLTANFDNSDQWGGANIADAKLSQGIDLFGASRDGSLNLSRGNGRSDFTKVSGNVGRLQNITGAWHAYIAGTAQYAWSPLLSSEQFGFGGAQYGRAYDSSELTGDDGMAMTAELRYSGLPSWHDIGSELFGFYDAGLVWNFDDFKNATSAASTGIGMRFQHAADLSGSFTIAQPLTHTVAAPNYGNGKNPRFFFSLGYRF